MYRASRVKRDSASNLYRQCQITGECPPDVKNKIEGDTLADRLLKWFGSLIYLGGLGIGTGRGTGGTFGYRPIAPSTTKPAIKPPPVRPNIAIDPLGPVDVVPTDIAVIDPSGPAIVPLTEGVIPDISGIDVVDPSLVPEGVDIVTEANPTITVEAEIHPNVTTIDEAAVLDIQETGPPAKKMLIEDVNTITQPTVIASLGHPDPDINVFVDAHFDAKIIGGYENIPLEPLNEPAQFEIAEPISSTPREELGRLITRTRDLYRRYTQQIQTTNPNFLGQVSRAVQFEFENPAFESDVSLIFERDVEALAAPDPDFADVRTLGRVRYSETPGRTIRVSRLGTKGTINTRSGVQIGPKVHFFMDLSAIPAPSETIELQPIGNFTGESTIVDNLVESSFIHNLSSDITFTDDDLLDHQFPDFSNSHLVLNFTEEEEPIFFVEPFVKPLLITDNFPITIYYPSSADASPNVPSSTDIPFVTINPLGSDYDIHPSLLKRRRKRKYSEIF